MTTNLQAGDRVRCDSPNPLLPSADELRGQVGTVTGDHDGETVPVRFDAASLSMAMHADELVKVQP